ncbi:hypothetical protein Slin15195_G079800 [Septoria linicola]|uniref:Uncharacterized protein n=1 Tax=Septoria linicola TaxID=215465 RepID=A0A9Q9EKC5_9PEZI|nr:hypothetical protein Slin15195_G079800 [Septoria linicola]
MIQFTRQFNRPPALTPLTFSALLFTTLLPLYLFSSHYLTHHPYGDAIVPTPSMSTANNTVSPSSSFIQRWLSTHLLHPFDPALLASYCNHSYSTTTPAPTPNLVLTLYDANGGIGNIRGNFLDFILLAIDLGAKGIFLPAMAARDEENLSNVWGDGGKKKGFGEMFDEEWFVGVVGRVCPGLSVYKSAEEGEGMEVVRAVEGVWRSGSRRVDLEDGLGVWGLWGGIELD